MAPKKSSPKKSSKVRGNITSDTSEAFQVQDPTSQDALIFTSAEDHNGSHDPETPYESINHNTSEFLKLKWRNVCSTLNNYTKEELENCLLTARQIATYGIVGLEVAETGTPHLQMYFEFASVKRISELRNLISPRGAFFKRRGNPVQASSYCRGNYMTTKGKYKPLNAECFEFGELSKQGERTDWRVAHDQVTEGRSVVDIIDTQPHMLPFIRSLITYKSLVDKPKRRDDFQVFVIFGKTGTRKTTWAEDTYPDAYARPDGGWWDGYSGELEVIWDDFMPEISLPTLLKWLRGSKLRLPVKGAFAIACYNRVVITANTNPNTWYVGQDPEHINAFRSRLTWIAEVNETITDKNPPVFIKGEEFFKKEYVPREARHPPSLEVI